MNFVLVSIWLLFPFFWLVTLRLASISVQEVSIPSILFWFVIAFGYLGYPILWFGMDPYRSEELVEQLVLIEMFLMSSMSLTSLFLGVLFGRVALGRLKLRDSYDGVLGCTSRTYRKKLILLSFGLWLICCFVLYRYVNQIGLSNLALLVSLDLVPSADVTALRSSATNAFPSYSRYKIFTVELMLFSTFIFYLLYLQKNELLVRILLFLSIIVSAFSLTMAGEKGQIMQLFIGLVLIHLIAKERGYFSIRKTVIYGAAALALIVPLYALLMGVESWDEAILQVLSRVTTGQLHPVYVYLQYFTEHRDFLLGSTFPNPGSLFPFEPVTITQEVMAWHNPAEAAAGVTGSMPAMFWVESYINFGLYSLPSVSFVLGGLLYLINYSVLRFRPDPIVISCYVWLILFYKNLAVSFFSDYFVSTYLLAVLSVAFVMYLVTNNGKLYLSRLL